MSFERQSDSTSISRNNNIVCRWLSYLMLIGTYSPLEGVDPDSKKAKVAKAILKAFSIILGTAVWLFALSAFIYSLTGWFHHG